MNAHPALAASALLLLLAGCTTTGESPSDGTGASPEPETIAGDAATECISRTWSLDVADAAAQLGEYMASNGNLTVVQAEGSGSHRITFTEDGTASSENDLSYILGVQPDSDITITVVQTHSGAASGEWAWSGDGTIVFPAWDNGTYTIQTQTLINDMATPTSVDVPSGSLAEGSTMTVQCSGGTLTTQVSGSPFTHHWTAAS